MQKFGMGKLDLLLNPLAFSFSFFSFFVFSEIPALVCITYLFNVISVMTSTSFSLNTLHLPEVKKMLKKTDEILTGKVGFQLLNSLTFFVLKISHYGK